MRAGGFSERRETRTTTTYEHCSYSSNGYESTHGSPFDHSVRIQPIAKCHVNLRGKRSGGRRPERDAREGGRGVAHSPCQPAQSKVSQ